MTNVTLPRGTLTLVHGRRQNLLDLTCAALRGGCGRDSFPIAMAALDDIDSDTRREENQTAMAFRKEQEGDE